MLHTYHTVHLLVLFITSPSLPCKVCVRPHFHPSSKTFAKSCQRRLPFESRPFLYTQSILLPPPPILIPRRALQGFLWGIAALRVLDDLGSESAVPSPAVNNEVVEEETYMSAPRVWCCRSVEVTGCERPNHVQVPAWMDPDFHPRLDGTGVPRLRNNDCACGEGSAQRHYSLSSIDHAYFFLKERCRRELFSTPLEDPTARSWMGWPRLLSADMSKLLLRSGQLRNSWNL